MGFSFGLKRYSSWNMKLLCRKKSRNRNSGQKSRFCAKNRNKKQIALKTNNYFTAIFDQNIAEIWTLKKRSFLPKIDWYYQNIYYYINWYFRFNWKLPKFQWNKKIPKLICQLNILFYENSRLKNSNRTDKYLMVGLNFGILIF